MSFWNNLNAEMRAHREMLEEQFIRDGMTLEEARAAARRQFGNELGALEESRDQWRFAWLDALLRDLRFAWRIILSQPVLTLTAVIVAALGVGANTAIVSVMETVMLKPLGLRDTSRICRATVRIDKIHMDHVQTSAVEFRDIHAMKDVFRNVAAMEGHLWTLQSGSEPVRVRGQAVSDEFFQVFDERPLLGRFFVPEDRDCLVLSHQFWKSQFGGDPNVVGKTVTLDGKLSRIVGVAGEHFRFPETVDAWSSLYIRPQLYRRGYNMTLWVLGRLNDNATPEQAADRVNRYVSAFKSTPAGKEMEEYRYFIDLDTFSHFVAGDLRRPLLLVWAAALAVLLTACANIAVLLLSRTAGRRKEIAIRLSLGATRMQILRQLAIESLMLGAMGGALGVAVSAVALGFIGRAAIPGKFLLQLVHLDWRLIMFGMGLSLACGLVFGLAPAIQLLRGSQAAAMKRAGRHRFQDTFIAAQVAAALVMLIATGLLLRSLWSVERISPGFDRSNLTTAMFNKPPNDSGFFNRLENALVAQPGIESSTIAYPLPFTGNGGLTSGFYIKGRPQPSTIPWHGAAWLVSPRYFDTMRIPVLVGRAFNASDVKTAPPVCLIDKTFAERFFPNENPIGQEISMHGLARIVGIVADIRSTTLERESLPAVYYPTAPQEGFPLRGLIVRSRIPAGPAIRTAVRQASPQAPVFGIETMDNLIGESLGIRRAVATLVCIFAGICILLAAIGLHGVVTQIVVERSGEIAVRMALGARPSSILAQFLKYGLRSGFMGVICGLSLSIYAQRALGNLLYDVKPFDPATFAEACAGIAFVLLIAVVWPARRASRTDPHAVLRHE